jgi:peptide/nickel transport system substrate-binding protein
LTRFTARQEPLPSSHPHPDSLVTRRACGINANSRRSAVFVVGIAIGALLAASCRGTEPVPGALVVGIEAAPNDLDPRFASDAASARIDELVFRSLTRLDQHRQHVPDLATDWRSDGPLAVRFEIRRDATFDDGTPLRADDVRATYESILDPRIASPKREALSFLRAVEAPDDHTVRFVFDAPFAPFLEATTVGILPRSRMRGAQRVLIGAGPYRIAAVERDEEVRLAARDEHRGIAEIRFRVVPDDTVRALEVDKGALDLVENALEPDNVDWLAGRPDVCVRRAPGTTFQYLGFNIADPLLSQLAVRQAIAHAIDRESLIRHLLGGAARPATGLLSPEHWAYEANVPTYPYDPTAAKRLLDGAGYRDPDGEGAGVRFRLSYKTSTLDSRRRIGEALQAMLGAVGIGLDVRSFEWATFYDDVRRGHFQLYSLAWIGVNDPDFYYSLLHSTMKPPAGNNRGGFADAEIDRLTTLGRRTFEPTERQRIYADVQRRAAAELPFVPLWWTDNVIVQSKRLCGFVPFPDGSLVSLTTAWLDRGRNRATGPSPCGCERSS